MSISSVGSSSSQQYQPLSFNTADTDQDGSLSLDEFSAIGQNVPGGNNGLDSSGIQKLFSAIDADGDGKISPTEAKTAFDKLSSAVQSQLLGVQEQSGGGAPPSPANAFAAADTDKSGGLSLDEFKAAASKHGGHGHHAHAVSKSDDPSSTQSADSDPLQALFNQIDTNGDGTVSQDELTSAFQSGPNATQDTASSASSTSSTSGGTDINSLFTQAINAYTNQSSPSDIVNQLLATLQTA